MTIRDLIKKGSTALRERREQVREKEIVALRLQSEHLSKERQELEKITAAQEQVMEDKMMIRALRKQRLQNKFSGLTTALYDHTIKERDENKNAPGLKGKNININDSSVFRGFGKLADDKE